MTSDRMLAHLRSADAVAREAAARDAMLVPRPSRARTPDRERTCYALRVGAVALVLAVGCGSSDPEATAPATTGGEGPGGVGEAAQGDVAGLVFEDALSEDLGDGLTPDQVASFEKLKDPVTQGRPAGSEHALLHQGRRPVAPRRVGGS